MTELQSASHILVQGGHTLGGNKFKDFSKPFKGLSIDCSITIPVAFYQVMFLAIT